MRARTTARRMRCGINSWEPWRPWGAPPATAACGEVLDWDEATYNAVKAELLSRRLIVPCRGRGGSVALADGSAVEASGNGQAPSRAPRTRAPNGSRAASTPSSFEQTFRAIDDCLRKEASTSTGSKTTGPPWPPWRAAPTARSWRSPTAYYGGIHGLAHGLHRALSKRFPFWIYDTFDADDLTLVAVLDARRDPLWTRQRLG